MAQTSVPHFQFSYCSDAPLSTLWTGRLFSRLQRLRPRQNLVISWKKCVSLHSWRTVAAINPTNACLGSWRDPERHILPWGGSWLNLLTLDQTSSWGVQEGISEASVALYFCRPVEDSMFRSSLCMCWCVRRALLLALEEPLRFSLLHVSPGRTACCNCWHNCFPPFFSVTGSHLVLLPE